MYLYFHLFGKAQSIKLYNTKGVASEKKPLLKSTCLVDVLLFYGAFHKFNQTQHLSVCSKQRNQLDPLLVPCGASWARHGRASGGVKGPYLIFVIE
jgi:hypothetical protein